MREYIKHMVECNCFLPQYINHKPPIFHKFIVFSIIEENGSIKPSYAECNNCGAIHRVKEVGVSVQIAKEMSAALPKIEEIKTGIPEAVCKILDGYKVDLSTWLEVKFIYDEQKWGKPVILSREEDGEYIVGKYLLILGEKLHKIDTFSSGDQDE